MYAMRPSCVHVGGHLTPVLRTGRGHRCRGYIPDVSSLAV